MLCIKGDIMDKVPVTAEKMKALLDHARRVGTIDQWINLAIEWMDHAQKDLNRLAQQSVSTDGPKDTGH